MNIVVDLLSCRGFWRLKDGFAGGIFVVGVEGKLIRRRSSLIYPLTTQRANGLKIKVGRKPRSN